MFLRRFQRRGFTLVEVLVTVGIVAILASLLIQNLLRVKLNANDTIAQATLKAIAEALENYYATNDTYPTDTAQILGPTLPYLTKNYFTGIHAGFTYSPNLGGYSYEVTALPVNASTGSASFTITTGGALKKNN